MSSELLSIGKTCSHKACSLVDFLPIKCQHCSQPFCSDHWKPQTHSCPKYDSTKHDRIAPECPFCQKPVAFAVGVDPNIAMEEHFETNCEVVVSGGLVGMRARKGAAVASASASTAKCARAKCQKVLITPITCKDCSQQFCPEHRFPTQHKCKTHPSTSTPSSSGSTPSSSTAQLRARPDVSSPRTNAALAAMSRAAASVNAKTQAWNVQSQSAPSSLTKPETSKAVGASLTKPSGISNPFNKTERWGSPSHPSTNDKRIDDIVPSHATPSISTTPITSTSISATNSTPITPPPPTSNPTPVIPQSFIPRSIFGQA